jgi:hypothetical protein
VIQARIPKSHGSGTLSLARFRSGGGSGDRPAGRNLGGFWLGLPDKLNGSRLLDKGQIDLVDANKTGHHAVGRSPCAALEVDPAHILGPGVAIELAGGRVNRYITYLLPNLNRHSGLGLAPEGLILGPKSVIIELRL